VGLDIHPAPQGAPPVKAGRDGAVARRVMTLRPRL